MPHRRAAWALLAVIAMHLVLLVWLGTLRALPSTADERPRATPIAVRMLALERPDVDTARRQAPLAPDATRREPPAPRATTTPRAPGRDEAQRDADAERRARAASRTAAPSMSTAPSTAPSPSASPPWSASTAAGASPPAASAAERALDLKLPRAFTRRPDTRSPVADDPRANTARTSPEQRMATTFDTRVIEEPLGDGRVRLRQGDACVIVAPSRASQMFAGDGSGGPAPRLVSRCP